MTSATPDRITIGELFFLGFSIFFAVLILTNFSILDLDFSNNNYLLGSIVTELTLSNEPTSTVGLPAILLFLIITLCFNLTLKDIHRKNLLKEREALLDFHLKEQKPNDSWKGFHRLEHHEKVSAINKKIRELEK